MGTVNWIVAARRMGRLNKRTLYWFGNLYTLSLDPIWSRCDLSHHPGRVFNAKIGDVKVISL